MLSFDTPQMAVDREAVEQFHRMFAIHAANEVAQARAFGGHRLPAISRARYLAAGEIAALHDIDLDDMLAMVDVAERDDRAARLAQLRGAGWWLLAIVAVALLVAWGGTWVLLALIEAGGATR